MRQHLGEKHPEKFKELQNKWKQESRKKRTAAKKVKENEADRKQKIESRKRRTPAKKAQENDAINTQKKKRRKNRTPEEKAEENASERKRKAENKERKRRSWYAKNLPGHRTGKIRPRSDCFIFKHPWAITALQDDPKGKETVGDTPWIPRTPRKGTVDDWTMRDAPWIPTTPRKWTLDVGNRVARCSRPPRTMHLRDQPGIMNKWYRVVRSDWEFTTSFITCTKHDEWSRRCTTFTISQPLIDFVDSSARVRDISISFERVSKGSAQRENVFAKSNSVCC